MSRMPSSLARHIPSGVTDDQANDSRTQYERKAWLDRGIILIGIDDDDIPWPLREMAGQYGVKKFKCRPGKAS